MKFNKIVCVDNTKLNDEAIGDLENFSEEVKVFSDYPRDNKEIIRRIGDAEAIVVSWHTEIDEEVIQKCKNLKYIGMACSLYDDESANVAVKYARQNGITVKGIRDYGDPGVAEFIISQLVQLLNGYGGEQWKEMPQEITGAKIGIAGLGVTGKLLADCLLPFKADIYYYSRNRKPDYEAKGVKYLDFPILLKECDIVSFHLPRNVILMREKEFQNFGNGKIIVNTSLGLPFDESYFRKWISHPGNYAIFDGDGKKELQADTEKVKGMILFEKSAGWSAQTLERLSSKVLENIKEFCGVN